MADEPIEKIKAAAFCFSVFTEENGMIHDTICGMNHADCFSFAAEKYGKRFMERNRDADMQGFITTKDRIVDRRAAYEIAKAADQLKYPNRNEYKDWLDSYEVNFALE